MNAGIHVKKVLLFYSANWEIWKVLATMISIVLSVFLRVLYPAIGLCILILIDMRFGIRKDIRNRTNSGEFLKSHRLIKNLHSSGLRKTFSKIADYLIVILAFIVFETILEHMGINLHWNNFTLSNLVVLMLCVNELKSIDENIRELQGVGLLRSVIDFVFRRKSVSEIVINTEDDNTAKK